MNSNINFRLRIGTQNIQHAFFLCLIYFLIPVFIIIPCSFSFASTEEYQIRMEINEQPFVFREVFKKGHLTNSSFHDRVDAFLDSVVKGIDTFLSAYKNDGNCDNNSDNGNDDLDTQVMLFTSIMCCIVIILSQR